MVSIVASQAIDPGSIPGWRRNSLGHDATNGPGVIMDKEEKCDLPSREWRGFESRSCLREISNFSCNQRQRKIAPNFGIKSGLGHCKNTYEKSASAGNRTRIYCLEGNNANLYTTDAMISQCADNRKYFISKSLFSRCDASKVQHPPKSKKIRKSLCIHHFFHWRVEPGKVVDCRRKVEEYQYFYISSVWCVVGTCQGYLFFGNFSIFFL